MQSTNATDLSSNQEQKQQQPPQQPPQWVANQWMGAMQYPTTAAMVSSVKIIRNKQTGQSEGYGFVEFYSREAAEKVLQSYNGSLMPNTEQAFRLNWASFSVNERRPDSGSDLSIFVGDLAADVTDTMLHETFSSRFQSVKGAKVVIDSNTGRSKGYGFVRFGDENERSRAMTEMNGVYCSSRPMRIGVATPKKASGYQQQYSSQAVVLAGGHASNGAVAQGSQYDNDSNNATNAEEAIQSLNGTTIGKQTVRLSWGRNVNKQWRADSGNQWNGGYYQGQVYGGYGYGYATPSNQDPSMYAAAAIPGAS
ncbi:Polyadenylate-binding protein RBP47 [Gossypium arboreum]|uniref:Polyadenylate-binding protein RBP47 n=1 Tax=Gossypium arboreum TaxID=29729 RepID=A0A0B0PXJ3_GOSAR|nr:Polyadenylate-binding protein RBP47 [Gossypium arboreum]